MARWTAVLRSWGRGLLRLPVGAQAGLVVAWMAMIWLLSSRESGPGPDEHPIFWATLGNLAHAPLFGILALLLAALVLRPQRAAPWPRLGPRALLSILLAVLAWAGLDEWHQSWVRGRHSSLLDVGIDLLGASLVLWTIAYLGRSEGRRSEGGLRLRLWVGVLLCVLASWITSLVEA